MSLLAGVSHGAGEPALSLNSSGPRGNAKQPMASLGILGICLPGPVILRELALSSRPWDATEYMYSPKNGD